MIGCTPQICNFFKFDQVCNNVACTNINLLFHKISCVFPTSLHAYVVYTKQS